MNKGQDTTKLGGKLAGGAGAFPAVRMRRLRSDDWIRRLVRETDLSPNHLVLPLFVREDDAVPAEIPSLPGVRRLTIEEAVAVAEEAGQLGIPAVAPLPLCA